MIISNLNVRINQRPTGSKPAGSRVGSDVLRRSRMRLGLLLAFLALVLAPGGMSAGYARYEEATPGADGTPASSPEDLGLVDDQAYVSPQFGHEVTWGDSWEADPESMESNPDDFLDRLSIVSESGRFQAFYVGAGDESAEEYAERLIEFREEIYPGLDVISQETNDDVLTIFYTFEEEGEQAVDIIELVTVDDGDVFQFTELIAYPDTADNAFDLVTGEVDVDGGPAFQVFDEFPVAGDD